jgi:hypothetical protein
MRASVLGFRRWVNLGGCDYPCIQGFRGSALQTFCISPVKREKNGRLPLPPTIHTGIHALYPTVPRSTQHNFPRDTGGTYSCPRLPRSTQHNFPRDTGGTYSCPRLPRSTQHNFPRDTGGTYSCPRLPRSAQHNCTSPRIIPVVRPVHQIAVLALAVADVEIPRLENRSLPITSQSVFFTTIDIVTAT